ncbi:MAG: AraC family transcriptional regulator [Bacteroidota bacterium]
MTDRILKFSLQCRTSTMTYYSQELERIKKICFSNEVQLERAINTKKYIDQHFDSLINLDVLAASSHTSKYHLIRVFKKYYGTTPRQYLINKRLSKAKEYLREGRSVSDTCFSIGFESINSFSNLFKAKNGMSPSRYRRAIFDKSE